MINKKLVKKIVDHTLHPEKKQFMDNHIMHPDREWSVGLLVGVGIFVFGVVWSLNAFDFYKTIEVESIDVEASAVVYRASMVDEALKDFADREKVYNSLLSKSQPAMSMPEGNKDRATTSTSTIESSRSPEITGTKPQTESETVSNFDSATSSTLIESEGGVILGD